MIARLLPSLVLQWQAIASGWGFLVSALGRGAHYLLAGCWASLLGLTVLAMGLAISAAGLAAGLVASLFFRLPADRPKSRNACGLLLRQFQPGRPGPHAAYGIGFVVTMAALALAFGRLASMVTAAALARRHPLPR